MFEGVHGRRIGKSTDSIWELYFIQHYAVKHRAEAYYKVHEHQA